jgi:acetylornithine deacetylase/succinyl-diaminopimelate desuccinylase-like protein
MAEGEEIDAAVCCVRRERVLKTAMRLCERASPTGDAGRAADELAKILDEAGLRVERHEAGHAAAPAVCVWLESGVSGPTLQFNGHLDVVHLPFVAPRVEGGLLRGSGAADMKGGVAAAVEAAIALREAGWPRAGRLLLTAHDLHEAPWGRGTQLDRMIAEGIVGDAVLIPEPLCTHLPIRGRGQACWLARFSRSGNPSHEVLHPADEGHPVIAAADLAVRLAALNARLAGELDEVAGHSSVFVGQIHGGALYNQSAREAWVEGTRRWVPGVARGEVERELRALVDRVGYDHRVRAELEYQVVRDAFALDPGAAVARAFQTAITSQNGAPLPLGAKLFVDDGNSFAAHAGVAAITHGPRAGGQHTTDEWVEIDDLSRVARVYVETAIRYWDVAEGL